MITVDGKRLMNNVLANRDTQIGTHIALGVNIVSDASIDGSTYPTTHNRYHSPYIVDEIPVINAGLIDGTPDEIVFTGQANASKYFIANNIALIALRSLEGLGQGTIVNATPENWVELATPITAPNNVKDFTEDGYFLLNVSNPRVYNNAVSLYGATLDDIIAFPITIHGITVPSGVAITVEFIYNDPNKVVYTSSITKTIGVGPNGYKFNNDSDHNSVTAVVDAENNPVPFLFQTRLKEFSDSNNLIANGDRITGVNVSVSGGTGYTLACGSIKLTPESINNFYRITTGFRKLNRVLYKTSTEAYVSAEYRILGVG